MICLGSKEIEWELSKWHPRSRIAAIVFFGYQYFVKENGARVGIHFLIGDARIGASLFTKSIHIEIGTLSNLRYVDLSRNNLSRSIPTHFQDNKVT